MSTVDGPAFEDGRTEGYRPYESQQQGQDAGAGQYAHGAPPPPPPPPWPGYYAGQQQPWPGYAGQQPGYQGQPGYSGQQPWPGGYFYGQPWPGYPDPSWAQAPRRRRRAPKLIAAAVAAAAVAAGGVAVASTAAAKPLTPAQIASKTDPGLVDVITTIDYGQGTAEGTGMVLTSNGEILTNNHVVDGATAVKVRDVGNGRTYTAKVVGYNATSDVAVLQLSGASGLRTVTTGNSGSVRVGQQVVALGNAEGKGGTPSQATGQVQALGAQVTASDEGSGNTEQLTGMIRTNAPIQPGDSGGPLVSGSGQVVGMNTAAGTSSGPVGTTAEETTAAFSIPISRALSIAAQIEGGHASSAVHIGSTAFLGVETQQNPFGEGGVTVAGTVQGTPAASAGLAQGDTIVSLNGQAVATGQDLQKAIEAHHPGDKVTVGWMDEFGQSHSASVTLAAGPVG